jgi:hypothetical protein
MGTLPDKLIRDIRHHLDIWQGIANEAEIESQKLVYALDLTVEYQDETDTDVISQLLNDLYPFIGKQDATKEAQYLLERIKQLQERVHALRHVNAAKTSGTQPTDVQQLKAEIRSVVERLSVAAFENDTVEAEDCINKIRELSTNAE